MNLRYGIVFLPLISFLGLADNNLALSEKGGWIVRCPVGISEAQGPDLLNDGARLGPPFEAAAGLPLPAVIEIGFDHDRPALVIGARFYFATVPSQLRPRRLLVEGSLFSSDSAYIRLGSVEVGIRAREVSFFLLHPLPLRRVRFQVVDAPVSGFGFSEIEILGRGPAGRQTVLADSAMLEAARHLGGGRHSVAVRLEGLEEALFSGWEEGSEPKISLLHAALIASGATDASNLATLDETYKTILDVARESVDFSSLDPAQRGRRILEWLHGKVFNIYEAENSDLRDTLLRYRYQCVTATVFYLAMAKDFGLLGEAVENGDHVFARIFDGQRWVDVETTHKKGYDPDRETLIRLSELKGLGSVPGYRRDLPPLGLAAAIYHNRALDALRSRDFKGAISLAIKSLRLDPGAVAPMAVLRAAYHDWAGALAGAGYYQEALRILAEIRGVDPLDLDLIAQELAVIATWARDLTNHGDFAQAVSVLEDGIAKSSHAPILEYFLAEVYGNWAVHAFDASGRSDPERAIAILESTERDLSANPNLDAYRQKIYTLWCLDPVRQLEKGNAPEDVDAARETSFVRFATALKRERTAPSLRRAFREEIALWASEEEEKAGKLRGKPASARRKKALQWFDRALALLGPVSDLTEMRQSMARRFGVEVLDNSKREIWPAVDMLVLPDQKEGRLNSAQIDLLRQWAREPWEKAGSDLEEAAGYLTLERYEQARARYPSNAALNEVWAAFLLELSDFVVRRGDSLRAAEILDASLASDPKPEVLDARRDQILREWICEAASDGDFALASARLASARKPFPLLKALDAIELQLRLDWCEAALDDGEGALALEILDTGLEHLPEAEALRRRRVRLFYQWAEAMGRNDPRAGAAVYSRGLLAEPAEENFRNNRAVLLSRWAEAPVDDFESAASRFEELVAEFPGDEPLVRAAARFFDLQARKHAGTDWDRAIAIYDRGLQLLPEHPQLLRNRRYCEREKEREKP